MLNELEALAKEAEDVTSFDNEPDWYSAEKLFSFGIGYEEDCKYIQACHPKTILRLIELVREMGEALATACLEYGEPYSTPPEIKEALAKYKELTK